MTTETALSAMSAAAWCTCCKPGLVQELREHAAAAYSTPALAADLRAMADEIEGDPVAHLEQQYRLNALYKRVVRESHAAPPPEHSIRQVGLIPSKACALCHKPAHSPHPVRRMQFEQILRDRDIAAKAKAGTP